MRKKIHAQWRIAPVRIILSGPISNSFKLLYLCSLPASNQRWLRKAGGIIFFHRSRARNSKMTGQIWPKFKLVWNFMPVLVTCKFDGDWTEKRWRTIFPIQSQWECSRANNSLVKSPARPKFELIPVHASLTKIRLKMTEKMWRNRFSHYMSMGIFCCHGNYSFDPICPKT